PCPVLQPGPPPATSGRSRPSACQGPRQRGSRRTSEVLLRRVRACAKLTALLHSCAKRERSRKSDVRPWIVVALVASGGFTSVQARSRQDGEGAGGKAQTLAHLRPGHHDQRSFRRHLVEIGHDLDLVVTVPQNI